MLIFGLIIFLFLILIRPQDFLPGLAGLPLVFVTMAILFLGWVIGQSPKKLFRTGQDKFVGLFLVAMVVSTISVHWLAYTAEIMVYSLKIGLIYYLVVTVVNDERKFTRLNVVLILLIAAVAGIGILQVCGWDITGVGMVWSTDKSEWLIRGVGIFDNPNDLAYSVMIVVPFALGYFLETRSLPAKMIWLLIFGISIYCIYLTRSRGGLIALIICLICWLYLWASSRFIRKVVIVIGIVGILVLVNTQAGRYRNDESSMGRVEAWAAGLGMVKEHPVIGMGKGQFIEHYERDSHSSFVRCLAELGMLGLYAWLGMVYCSAIFLVRARRINRAYKLRVYVIGFAAFLFAYLCASIFSTRTYDIVFIISLAMISALNRLLSSNESNGNVMKGEKRIGILNRNVALLTVGVVVALKLFLMQVW